MTRTTNVISISLPPKLYKQTQLMAKKFNMTRSELLRDAFRQYAEAEHIHKIMEEYEDDKRNGRLKKLRGSITDLMI